MFDSEQFKERLNDGGYKNFNGAQNAIGRAAHISTAEKKRLKAMAERHFKVKSTASTKLKGSGGNRPAKFDAAQFRVKLKAGNYSSLTNVKRSLGKAHKIPNNVKKKLISEATRHFNAPTGGPRKSNKSVAPGQRWGGAANFAQKLGFYTGLKEVMVDDEIRQEELEWLRGAADQGFTLPQLIELLEAL